MKRIFIFLLLVTNISFCYAQYNKEKLTEILTGGSTKTWTVKAMNAAPPKKSYTFNKDFSVNIGMDNGTPQAKKWALSTADNIRWFISIGNQKYELIVSYDKAGKQYVKLTNQAGDKASVYSETILYPVK